MKKLLIIAIATNLIIGCAKNDSPVNEYILNNAVEFNILNENGDDLLNKSTSGYFSVDKMKLFYLINGEKYEVYDENMALPRNIGLVTEVSPYRLGIATYSGEEGLTNEENGIKTGISIAYLELNEVVTDTIKTEWESKENKYFVVKKVWYNSELQESAEEIFSVIKSN